MAELRRRDFRDPAVVLEEKQNRTCLGCIYLWKSPLGGPEVACRLRKKKAKKCVDETRRCESYCDGTTG